MSVVLVAGATAGPDVRTAAAALAALGRGRVAVLGIAQTGLADGVPGDVAAIASSTGARAVELHRYPDALPVHLAAARSGRPAPSFVEVAGRVSDLADEHELVVVPGSGALATPYTGDDRWTLLDLAATVHAPVLLVVDAAAPDAAWLSLALLADDGADLAGVVIGGWPDVPSPLHRAVVADLAAVAPLGGVLPAAVPDDRAGFARTARASLGRRLGGRWSSTAFLAELQRVGRADAAGRTR